MNEHPPVERLFSAEELAAILGIAGSTPYDPRWRKRVGLTAVKIGGLLRFKEQDVRRLLAGIPVAS